MADYRSILNRAISGLPQNTEEARRTIYDKARNALMRQLSSLEPALSPAEISKQRLQLEEAIRDTENQFHTIETLDEDDIANIVDIPGGDNEAVPEHSEKETAPEPEPEVKAEIEVPPAPAFKPAPEPSIAMERKTAAPPMTEPRAPETPEPEGDAASDMAADDADEMADIQSEPATPESNPGKMPAPEPEEPAAASPETEISDEIREGVSNEEEAQDARLEQKQESQPVLPAAPLLPDTSVFKKTSPVTVSHGLKGQDLVDKADETLARVDALRSEKSNALDELKETMAKDGVPLKEKPEIFVTADRDRDRDREYIADTASSFTPEISIAEDDAALIAASSGKPPGGRGLVWILSLLILFGACVFTWARRDALTSVAGPLYKKAEQTMRDTIASFSHLDQSPAPSSSSGDNGTDTAQAPVKNEDRILNTPLPTSPDAPQQSASPVRPEPRTALPADTQNEPLPPVASPRQITQLPPENAPVTPAQLPPTATTEAVQPNVPAPSGNDRNENAGAVPPGTAPQETNRATAAPVTNIFTSSAILYEERKDSGRPDVSTGNVVWSLLPSGSEAIGSRGLPSVRGNARIQNRDLRVRFEIMRNLDEALPASHLIEIEFEIGRAHV